jgi:transcriptional regulator with XRE-family HTH domain
MTTANRQKRRRPRRLNHEPTAVTWTREKCGLTKRALARSIGISEQLMNEIESGWRSATPANLNKIAEVLNCPVVVLERKRCTETLPATASEERCPAYVRST